MTLDNNKGRLDLVDRNFLTTEQRKVADRQAFEKGVELMQQQDEIEEIEQVEAIADENF